MSTHPAPIRLDVWVDVVCPWCLIGLRRLDQALTEHAARPDAIAVEVRLRSFELEPDAPLEAGASVVEHLAERMGASADEVRAMMARVNQHAATVGVTIDFDRVRSVGTRRAHEVLQLALDAARQREVAAALTSAHFLEGADLSDVATLVSLAAGAGLEADAVAAALASGERIDAVRADEALARELGVSGVPAYAIDGALALGGAQPVETLVAALAAARTSTPSDA
ncbi:MAG: hypothetical protein RLZZ272_204 [Actinomycetota bacterium]